jgi:hypothetical protein
MSLLGLLGLALMTISVLAAYRLGHAAGLQEGRQLGYDDGKKAGTKEGSMRGYAVGYDRGRRAQQGGGTDEPAPKKYAVSPLVIVIAVVVAMWIVANVAGRYGAAPPAHPTSTGIDPWTSEANLPQSD